MALQNQTPRRVTGGILTIILCVVSLAFTIIWSYEGGMSADATGPLHSVRSLVAGIVTPFDRVSSVIGQSTDTLGSSLANATARPQTISDLQDQIEELSALVMRYEEYRLENERLKMLLDLKDAYDLEGTVAHILRTSIDSFNQTITIDKGSEDGLAVGMPVMSPNGLIGQIESVAPHTSQIRLLTDPNSGVAVIIESSRAEGVLTGSYSGLLYLDYIYPDVTVVPGDAIITSGGGGVYPKGIIIGEVTSVQCAPSDVFQTIIVKPLVKVRYYEEVLVLTGRQTEVSYSSAAISGSTQAADAAATAVDTSAAGGADSAGNAGPAGSTDSTDSADGSSADGSSAGGGAGPAGPAGPTGGH